ncbi:MAG: tyrosine-protein phosphatase [Clostridia bacterium]|nr:tyrosine-protein phosphatase [Clostridia bacterium]
MKRVVLEKLTGTAAAFMAFVLFLVTFGCAPKKESGELINATPSSGQAVAILSEPLRSFFADYKGIEVADTVCDGKDLYYPAPVKISWTADVDADYYIVGLSLGKEIEIAGSEGVQYFVTDSDYVEAEELFCGKTYYYRVFAIKGDEAVASIVFSFKTEDFIRTVTIDGVSNTRDLGGKIASNGKRIKQGIIYRGGNIDGITKQGKIDFLEKLGIKTEIDLREGTEISVMRKSVNVVSCKAPCYVYNSMGMDLPEYQPGLAKEIKVFADPDNYPIYFHCAIGRDRTGTLALILQLLVGVDEEQIKKDYITSFYSSIAYADGAKPSATWGNITATLKWFDEYADGTRLQNLEKFLMDIGVTADEIEAIRENILES